jgi:hypothetical protein
MTRFAILFAAALIGLSLPTQVVAGDRDDGSPNSNSAPKTTAAITESDHDKLVDRIVGEVKTPEGKPAAGAHVVVIGTPWQGENFVYDVPTIKVIAESICDQNGAFRLEHFKQTPARWQLAQLFVVADGCGLVWRPVDLYQPMASPIRITLPTGHEMRGRVTTPDGQPAVGVRIGLTSIGQPRNPDKLVLYHSDIAKDTFPVTVLTDANGEYAVKNLPPDVSVFFYVDHEPYARSDWKWDVDDSAPHTAKLKKGRVVSGTVVAADTGQPLPQAIVVAFSRGVTDAKGRFQRNQPLLESFSLRAYAPNGTPYLGKSVTFNHPQPDPINDLKIELSRGVLVRGQVIEQPSGRPIAHAGVNYVPRDSNLAAKNNLFPGSNWLVTIADEHGSFVMGVPTGQGTLVVTAAGIDDVCRPVSQSLLTSGKADDLNPLDNVNIFAQLAIDVPPGAIEFSAQLDVERGETIKRRIVGSDGTTPELLKMIFRDRRTLYSDRTFHPTSRTVFDGQLQIRGLAPDEGRLVWLVDPLAKQGKLLHVKASDGDVSDRIALEPCGAVTMRFVDGENHPVPGYTPELPPIQLMFLPEETVQGNISDQIVANADGLLLDLFDYRNAHDFTTDQDGRMTFSALIPGAIYQVSLRGVFRYIKIGSGEQLEIPVITITDQKVIAKASEAWKAKSTDRAANNSSK